jgi:hypothetical protein
MIHDHAAVIAVLAAGAVLLLASRRDRAAAGPVYVTRRSPVAALGILLAGAGALIYARRHPAPAAAPAPRPSVVTRTVTQQVTRYVPLHNWPVSGAEITLLGLGVLAAAVLIVRLAGRYFGR